MTHLVSLDQGKKNRRNLIEFWDRRSLEASRRDLEGDFRNGEWGIPLAHLPRWPW